MSVGGLAHASNFRFRPRKRNDPGHIPRTAGCRNHAKVLSPETVKPSASLADVGTPDLCAVYGWLIHCPLHLKDAKRHSDSSCLRQPLLASLAQIHNPSPRCSCPLEPLDHQTGVSTWHRITPIPFYHNLSLVLSHLYYIYFSFVTRSICTIYSLCCTIPLNAFFICLIVVA